jgi:hypothetical protein
LVVLPSLPSGTNGAHSAGCCEAVIPFETLEARAVALSCCRTAWQIGRSVNCLPSTAVSLLGNRHSTPLDGVTLFVAVGALHARPVRRLGALTTGVAELVAVAALDLGHVARLRALLGDVALLVAVTADHDTLLLALLGAVTLLTAVAADVGLAVRALLGHVAFVAAVAAATATLLGRLLAVASTVTRLVAVDAHLNGLLDLTLLLLAPGGGVARLLAVAADGDEAVHGEAGLTETVDVVFGGGGPSLGEDGTLRLGGPLDGHGVLLVRLALEVDKGPVDGNVLLPGDQVGVEVVAAESLLEILQGGGADGLGVDEESLRMSVSVSSSKG